MNPYAKTTSRRVADGGRQRVGSLSASTQYSGTDYLIPLPPDPRSLSARALLKRGYVAQALIDSTAVLFCFLFVLAVALSIPLALFLLMFASF